ncbi:alkaline phosphatase D family protein [Corynebacterium sp. 35RC1]|nr:alkaline phosphatase D family protein [Corynebacterium sp. 35RC1]
MSFPFRTVSRRRFLQGAALGSVVGATAPPPARAASEAFVHGVASGDPDAHSVILWTRITPEPGATPGSGVGGPVELSWQVAADPEFHSVVLRGATRTDASRDHTVKVLAGGLPAGTRLWYRFQLDSEVGQYSPVGCTRTLPSPGETAANCQFAVASCSNFETGFFSGYRDIATRDELVFVLHLGDFTYENESGKYDSPHTPRARTVQPPHHTLSLADYRIRQGAYHLDPDLQLMLAAKPLIAMWDDHEIQDNTWREGFERQDSFPGVDFAQLKAAATQAYLEWMPVREAAGMSAPAPHRELHYGNLMHLLLPDLRSFRDQSLLHYSADAVHRNDPNFVPQAASPQRSAMGQEQFAWFRSALEASSARWQVVGTQIMFAPMTLPYSLDPEVHQWLVDQLGLPEQGIPLNTDQWDGFAHERQQIVDLIAGSPQLNVVFLAGDIHSSWANNIPTSISDARRAAGAAVPEAAAVEFVAPSLTAPGLFETINRNEVLRPATRALLNEVAAHLQRINPWHRAIDFERHGYLAIEVDTQEVRAKWRYSQNLYDPKDVPVEGMTARVRHGVRGVELG